MSFFKAFSANLVSTVSNLASKANLDRLHEEEDRNAEAAAAKPARNSAPKVRPGQLPLGDEYAGLNFTYITDNIIAMGFPSSTDPPTRIRSKNDATIVGKLLKERHKGYFMIWNLSEESYDGAPFENQVLEFSFPGYPAPPLGLMFKLCTSVENWLNADPNNVAVIHCMTGKGRTAVVVAAVLAWMGYAESPMQALNFVSEARHSMLERMANPSQRRYVQYFSNMMDGVKPKPGPLVLRRVILNGIPDFTNGGDGFDPTGSPISGSPAKSAGCRPHLQIFKAGALLFSSTWASGRHYATEDEEAERCRFYSVSEGSVRFGVDVAVEGDVLIRCRHFGTKGHRETMFRAAFHTGYVRQNLLRFSLSQLDMACHDSRFPHDAFVELIFSSPDAVSDDVTAAPPSPTIAAQAMIADAAVAEDSHFWEQVEKRKKDRGERRDAAAALRHRAELRANVASAKQDDKPARRSSSTGDFGISGDGSDDEPEAKRPEKLAMKAAAFDLVDSDDELESKLTASASEFAAVRARKASGKPIATSATHTSSVYQHDADELDALERELGLSLGMSDVLRKPLGDERAIVAAPVPVTVAEPVAEQQAPVATEASGIPETNPVEHEATNEVDADVPHAVTEANSVEVEKPVATSVAASSTVDDIDALESFLDNL